MKTYKSTGAHFSQNKSNFLFSIVIASILILFCGYAYYRHESRTIRDKRENHLKAVASVKATKISGEKILLIENEAGVREMTAGMPHIPVILSSGYTDERIRKNIKDDSRIRFIQKPSSIIALLKTVQQSLKQRNKPQDKGLPQEYTEDFLLE